MVGAPADTLNRLPDPPQVAVLPERIPHIKPRLLVAEGEPVRIGAPLFEDKRDTRFKFLSPAGGTIQRIQYGPRRVVEAIVVERDKGQEAEVGFPALDEQGLAAMSRDQLVARILEGGLWWVLRALPFRDLPDPDGVPPLILVGLGGKEPFLPSPAVYLKDQAALLDFGLKVLRKLSGGPVVLFADAGTRAELGPAGAMLTHAVEGEYPCDDPGAVLYHIKRTPAENRAWFVSGADLLLLAQMLTQGRYPTRRIVSVGGAAAPVCQHYSVRLGAPLSQLVDAKRLAGTERWIVGGLLRGYAASAQGFMGLYETSLNLIPADQEPDFMALFNPGWGRPSYSRTFLSKLNPGPLVYDCKLHGDRRACIACLHCASVCPVRMLPHMVYKAVLAEEVEEYLQLGLLDCVECGLCAYVCPSKIELSQTFVATRRAYAREQARKSE